MAAPSTTEESSSTRSLAPGGRVITLEEFIIDTFTRIGNDGIERPIDRPDELGGGGSYGIIGARMFLPPRRLGMIVDYTPDSLPSSMRADLEAYGDMWVFRERVDGQATTRSVNRYDGDLRGFEYLSRPLLLTPADILDTPWCQQANPTDRQDAQCRITAIHMISDVDRLDNFEQDMNRVREVVGEDWDPKIVWEPNPADANPNSVPLFRRITPQVDILSPNHSEIIKLLSLPNPELDDPNSAQSLRNTLEVAARTLLAWQPRIGIVIRAGAMGACYIGKGYTAVVWVPAYWSEGAEEGWADKVVDPTGAGNAFCGAMAAALNEGKGLRDAVIWGTVAASFVVQQHGLPKLTVEGGKECWAGEEVAERIAKLERRLGKL